MAPHPMTAVDFAQLILLVMLTFMYVGAGISLAVIGVVLAWRGETSASTGPAAAAALGLACWIWMADGYAWLRTARAVTVLALFGGAGLQLVVARARRRLT